MGIEIGHLQKTTTAAGLLSRWEEGDRKDWARIVVPSPTLSLEPPIAVMQERVAYAGSLCPYLRQALLWPETRFL
jgi:hypothetical protein